MANFCIRCGNRLDAAGTCTACAEKPIAPPPPAPPSYGAPPAAQNPYSAPQHPGYSAPSMPQQPAYTMPPQYPGYGIPTQAFNVPVPPQYPGYGMPPQQPQVYNVPATPQQPPYSAPLQSPYSAPPMYYVPPAQPQVPVYGAPAAPYQGMPYPYNPTAGQKPRRREKPVYDDSHLPLYGSPEMLEQMSDTDKTAMPFETLKQVEIEPTTNEADFANVETIVEPARQEQEE